MSHTHRKTEQCTSLCGGPLTQGGETRKTPKQGLKLRGEGKALLWQRGYNLRAVPGAYRSVSSTARLRIFKGRVKELYFPLYENQQL